MRLQKYRNVAKIVDGIKFDSKKEANHYQKLKLLEAAGVISDLQFQVKFTLIPSQYTRYEVPGKTKMLVRQKCVEKECNYMADFVFIRDGKQVVQDTKGFHTKDYVIKRKLMLQVHGISIEEI